MKHSEAAQMLDHVRTYNNATERWEQQRRLVMVVIATYRAVCSLEPIVAANNNPESRSRRNKWSPDSCHFKCDCENAVTRVIEAKPESERPALWTAWDKLLSDDNDKLGWHDQRLIRLLAGSFYTKELHPAIYFKPRRLTPKDAIR